MTDGVPVIAPVPELIVNPVGRDGETLYTRGVTPPAPVTGVKLAATRPCVKALDEIDWKAVAGELTAIWKVFDAVAPF